jgi:hypothetical protein
MKVLMLVISSQTQPVYRHHKAIWETYMKSHPDIECYFIEFTPAVLSPLLTSNTLFLRGRETYPGILEKTFKALDYFTRRKHYHYVIRTNLSSVWIFPKLMRFLETVPRTGVYGGIINNNQPWPYISGAGITFSWDVVQILLQNRHIAYANKFIDDVDIGFACVYLGISTTSIPRVDVGSVEDVYKEGFHYRVRFLTDRTQELPFMRKILSID